MQPSEFWQLHPKEFWWLVEANRAPKTYAGGMTESEVREIYDQAFGKNKRAPFKKEKKKNPFR